MGYYVPNKVKPVCYNCPYRTNKYCGLLTEHDYLGDYPFSFEPYPYCPLIEVADRKTENSSEKPNNSTISKMEQVEDEPKTQMKTQNSNLTFEKADEPQTEEHCETCRHKDECEGATYEYKNTEWWCLAYAPIDEPQTDCSWK